MKQIPYTLQELFAQLQSAIQRADEAAEARIMEAIQALGKTGTAAPKGPPDGYRVSGVRRGG